RPASSGLRERAGQAGNATRGRKAQAPVRPGKQGQVPAPHSRGALARGRPYGRPRGVEAREARRQGRRFPVGDPRRRLRAHSQQPHSIELPVARGRAAQNPLWPPGPKEETANQLPWEEDSLSEEGGQSWPFTPSIPSSSKASSA